MTTRKNSSRAYRAVRAGLNRPLPRSAPRGPFWVRAGGGTSAIGGRVVVVVISVLPGSGDVNQVRHDQDQDDDQQDRADCRGVGVVAVSYTHLRAHETRHDLVCRLLLEKKKK